MSVKITGTTNCCGATISRAKIRPRNNRATNRGIRIFATKVGEEVCDEKDQIKHVEVKGGGYITVCVKRDF